MSGLERYPDKTTFMVSENLLASIASSKNLSKLREILYSPIFRASDLSANYRFLNNLEAVGLLPKKPNKAGWRKLNWVEHVYILIVVELRKYGMKTDAIRPFMALFLNENNNAAIVSLLAVMRGVEISLIFKPDGTCAILDPLHTGLYEAESLGHTGIVPERGAGELQFKLSYFVNRLWENVGLSPIDVQEFFGKQQQTDRVINSLSEAEKEAVLKTRNLTPTEKLSVRRGSANDVLFDIESNTEIQDDVAEQLISLVGGDFGKFNGSVRNGKIVGIKTTKSNKVQDN